MKEVSVPILQVFPFERVRPDLEDSPRFLSLHGFNFLEVLLDSLHNCLASLVFVDVCLVSIRHGHEEGFDSLLDESSD